MRAFLKRFLPWHLRQTLGWARFFHAARKPPFEGIYARFDEVPVSDPWVSEDWSAQSRSLATARRAEIGKPLPEGIAPAKALLPTLATAMAAGSPPPLRILDFGGAAGVDYGNLLASLGGTPPELEYFVVDTPGCCEAGREAWAGDPRIRFGTRIPDPPARFDLVYSAGVINLIEDWRGTLRAFTALSPRMVLLCKVPMHDGPTFVRRQTNMGKGHSNPIWALGIRDVTDAMDAAGYALTYRGYGPESYNVDTYPDSHKVGRVVNLLFARRDQ